LQFRFLPDGSYYWIWISFSPGLEVLTIRDQNGFLRTDLGVSGRAGVGV